MSKKQIKLGAPTKYQEKYNDQARKLCLMGYTDPELADFFEVSLRSINNWKIEYPLFMQSLKLGKDIADAEVTASLYERAVGYSHTETKVFNNQGEIMTHDVKRLYPPDPLSIKYWLNNRQPGKWREKVETDEMGNSENIIQKVQIEVVGGASKE